MNNDCYVSVCLEICQVILVVRVKCSSYGTILMNNSNIGTYNILKQDKGQNAQVMINDKFSVCSNTNRVASFVYEWKQTKHNKFKN